MKILKSIFVMAVLLISGCANEWQGYADLRAQNRASLMNLELGMSKSQVVSTFGDKSYGEISNPFKREIFPAKDGNVEVLYYYTEYIDYRAGKGWESGVTPVVLKDNKVVGWGWKYLDDSNIRQTITIKRN